MRSIMNGYYALRWQILERDNFTCQYCGQRAPDAKLEVDHKIPVSEGGKDEPDNLVTSCYACNRGKSALSIISLRKGKKTPKGFSPSLHSTHSTRDWREREVNELLVKTPGLTYSDVAKLINLSLPTTYALLSRMRRRMKAQWLGGKWYPLNQIAS